MMAHHWGMRSRMSIEKMEINNNKSKSPVFDRIAVQTLHLGRDFGDFILELLQ